MSTINTVEKLQQELSQVREELEKYTLPSNNTVMDIPLNRQIQILNKQLVDSEQQCDLLAKQNHKLREALESIRDYNDNKEFASVAKRLMYEALTLPDLSSLIVLSRAEAEKLPCGCKKIDGMPFVTGQRHILNKCPRCLLLERL